MAYEINAYNVAGAHRAVNRMEREGKDPSTHVLGTTTWEQVHEVLDAEEIILSVDSLSSAPYRVFLGDGITDDALGWIDVTWNDDPDPDGLDDVMEFDHIIKVNPDGSVTEPIETVCAPECIWEGFGDGQHIEPGTGWTLLHASEYIGGSMAEYILANPGYYVAVVCDRGGAHRGTLDSWAVAFRPAE